MYKIENDELGNVSGGVIKKTGGVSCPNCKSDMTNNGYVASGKYAVYFCGVCVKRYRKYDDGRVELDK